MEISSRPRRVRIYQKGDALWNLELIRASKPRLKATIIREAIMNMRDKQIGDHFHFHDATLLG